uniref:Enolase n=1 Tax=Glossina austeni TaxID=7395 RepID=A0A1A9V0N9_GLOAU
MPIKSIQTQLGLFRTAVSSGDSNGVHEVLELRDKEKNNYHGKSIFKAVCHLNEIVGLELIKTNLEVTEQEKTDEFTIKLVGIKNKSKYRANAILGISLAVCKAGVAKKAIGDEGGFAPNIQSNKEALCLIKHAIELAGYTDDLYQEFSNGRVIVSIEDAFDQDHWDTWSAITADTKIQIVGDDLTITNPKRIKTGVEKKACNCLLLKVNQIGTVTESPITVPLHKVHLLARENGWGHMVSHHSGETEDSFIADLVEGRRGLPAKLRRERRVVQSV